MASVQCVERSEQTGRELPPSMVERMTLILDAFAGPTSRMTLEEVSRATHLPRSTAHRILDQLVKLSWLEHTAFGYGLGTRLRTLGAASDSGAGDLRAEAAPLLHELMVSTGLVVHLAVLEGGQVRYLDKMGGRFAASVPSRVGGRAPAHSTALGKAMLAWTEAEQVDEIVGQGMTRFTRHTISNLGLLHQELNRIRSRGGLAFERGECFAEISCVAAAIRGPEGPIGAISLVGLADAPLERVAPLVAAATRKLTSILSPELEREPRARRRSQVPQLVSTWSPQTMNRLVAVGESSWM